MRAKYHCPHCFRHTASMPNPASALSFALVACSLPHQLQIRYFNHMDLAFNQPLYRSQLLTSYTPALLFIQKINTCSMFPQFPQSQAVEVSLLQHLSIRNEIPLEICNIPSFQEASYDTLLFLCFPLVPPHHFPLTTAHASDLALAVDYA